MKKLIYWSPYIPIIGFITSIILLFIGDYEWNLCYLSYKRQEGRWVKNPNNYVHFYITVIMQAISTAGAIILIVENL